MPALAEGLGEAVASPAASVAPCAASDTLSVVPSTVSFTVSVTFSAVSLTGSEASEVSLPAVSVESEVSEEPEAASSLALAEGVGVGLALSSAAEPPVKTPVIASPMSSSRLPPLSEAEGLGVAVSPDWASLVLLAEGVGVGSAPPSEPESDEEESPAEPEESEDPESSEEPEESEESSPAEADADGVGSAASSLSVDSSAPGDAEASSSRAATHSLYSSAVRLLDVGFVELLLSACARVGVKPIPIRTAVGIAARAIALPAGMWNLVNSGFLGAA
jgi:hypothetical protein